MAEEQLKTVKEYIKKYNLEDELSNAVNQAIKLDSDDPYRVISDYLRKFAKVCTHYHDSECPPKLRLTRRQEQDEEEDEEDDVIQEGEEPVMRPAGRRQQVCYHGNRQPDALRWAAMSLPRVPFRPSGGSEKV